MYALCVSGAVNTRGFVWKIFYAIYISYVVSPLLTFVATGRIWPDLYRHRVRVWDRLCLVFELIPSEV